MMQHCIVFLWYNMLHLFSFTDTFYLAFVWFWELGSGIEVLLKYPNKCRLYGQFKKYLRINVDNMLDEIIFH